MVKDHQARRPKIPSFDQTHEFFGVYIPGQNSERMEIPPDFVKQFNVPDKVILKDLRGKLWNVEVEEDKDALFFANGWQEFVKDSCIEEGEFLVFRYNGISSFTVRIFGRDECIKTATEHVKVETVSETESEESRGHKEGSGSPMNKRSSISAATPKIEEDAALKAATKLMTNSKHPSFQLVMGKTYLEKGYLDIPPRTAKMMQMRNGTKIVKLQVSNKVWSMNLTSHHRMRFCGGWRAFASENSLRIGDICLFEVTDKDYNVFKVSIFRRTN